MATVAIDTLAAVRKLEKAGFKTEQAEAVAEVVGHQGDELATKEDLRREVAGLRWTFGILFLFLFTLNLAVLGFVYQSNQQISQLTQQVGHLSGVVERLPGADGKGGE